MAIKSILCHMANDERHRDRLELAIQLTTRFQGHLDVLYNTAPVTMPAGAAGRAASNVYLAEQRDIAKKKADGIRQELVDRFSKADCSHEYHQTEGDHVATLAEYAHLSDLVVVSQAPPKGISSSIALHHPEDIALEAGCGTLVLPHEEEFWAPDRKVGTRIAVGWRNCKEAIRAIREAKPFLLEADEVHVFTEQDEAHSLMGVGIGRYLSMHGVKATVHSDIDSDGNIGEQLLARSAAYECDLLVMGAYSRARWREKLFGGVSEYILHHLDRPVLMAH